MRLLGMMVGCAALAACLDHPDRSFDPTDAGQVEALFYAPLMPERGAPLTPDADNGSVSAYCLDYPCNRSKEEKKDLHFYKVRR